MSADFTPAPVPDDVVAAIERATLAAVAPDAVHALPGWLVPTDPGTIGRAHSAVPLSHDPARQAELVAGVPEVVALYRAQGLKPVFRLPAQALALQQAVAGLGARLHEPTWVMQGRVSDLGAGEAPPAGLRVTVDHTPAPDWQALYLGEGFDPVDGACRVRNLSRAACNRYVTATLHGEPVACGAASLAPGWLGVHGMRTALAHRGQGWAGCVLRAMAELAHAQGVDRVFLQVGAANLAAQRLYQRRGLVRAWDYAYWRFSA
jgi:GNAT superfamily N-acetyltransferase